MADYPNEQQSPKTFITPINQQINVYGPNNIPHVGADGRKLHVLRYKIKVVHNLVSDAVKTTFENFYISNRSVRTRFLMVYVADGVTYNCFFESAPEMIKGENDYWIVTNYLIGGATSLTTDEYGGTAGNYPYPCRSIGTRIAPIKTADIDTAILGRMYSVLHDSEDPYFKITSVNKNLTLAERNAILDHYCTEANLLDGFTWEWNTGGGVMRSFVAKYDSPPAFKWTSNNRWTVTTKLHGYDTTY